MSFCKRWKTNTSYVSHPHSFSIFSIPLLLISVHYCSFSACVAVEDPNAGHLVVSLTSNLFLPHTHTHTHLPLSSYSLIQPSLHIIMNNLKKKKQAKPSQINIRVTYQLTSFSTTDSWKHQPLAYQGCPLAPENIYTLLPMFLDWPHYEILLATAANSLVLLATHQRQSSIKSLPCISLISKTI